MLSVLGVAVVHWCSVKQLFRGRRHRGGGAGVGVGGVGGGGRGALFCVTKRKTKGKKGFKAGTIKRLSPRSKCQNIIALTILERLEFEIFLVGQPQWPTILFSVPCTPPSWKSISPALFSKHFDKILKNTSLAGLFSIKKDFTTGISREVS